MSEEQDISPSVQDFLRQTHEIYTNGLRESLGLSDDFVYRRDTLEPAYVDTFLESFDGYEDDIVVIARSDVNTKHGRYASITYFYKWPIKPEVINRFKDTIKTLS